MCFAIPYIGDVDAVQDIVQWLPEGSVSSAIQAGFTILLGFLLAFILGAVVRRTMDRFTTPERAMLGKRVAFYTILGLALASALGELGFNLSVLLGAAGIVTVAIGFASQTSASNLISGLFLVLERPFSVGDYVTVGSISGEVIAVDLMGVKVRTYDNLYVRIPNETVMKAEITNLTRYPIRRVNLEISVAYKEDLARVREVLVEVADRMPAILDEPRPFVMFLDYGNSGINLRLGAWAVQETFWETKVDLAFAVKRAFDDQNIEIPFPHVSLYSGAASRPIPVQVMGPPPPDAESG